MKPFLKTGGDQNVGKKGKRQEIHQELEAGINA